MIRVKTRDEAAKVLVREAVCTRCYKRPIDSEVFSNGVARVCEPGCAVFRNMRVLEQLVEEAESDSEVDYEARIQKVVCADCKLSATAGPDCVRRLQQTCPLSLYADRIVRAIEPAVARPCGCD